MTSAAPGGLVVTRTTASGACMLLLLATLSLPSAHAAKLNFPKAAPQAGDTAGCPAVSVLSRRFSHQSDANGGGFGFYAAKYDDKRQPSIGVPSEQWVNDYVAGKTAGSYQSLEDQLRTLFHYSRICALCARSRE